MRQLLLDTETTGFEPKAGHRIIEFAALEMINRKLTGNSLHLYFNPERDIPLEATNVHGITLSQVKDQPVFEHKVDEIIQFISGAELIIHNAKFDLNFLDHHFTQLGKQITLAYASKSTDTLAMARDKFPGGKNSLNALCDRFNIDRSNRTYHGALIDCELLAEVYLELTREQISLLGEDTSKRGNKPQEFKQFALPKSPLVAVKVSESENLAHLNYLKELDKTSKGQSTWFNKIKDFIDDSKI